MLNIGYVNIGDLELSPSGGPKGGRNVCNNAIVEVQSRDRVMRFGRYWFLFDAKRLTIAIELYDAVALRVGDVVRENCGPRNLKCSPLDCVAKATSVKDVIPENKRRRIVPDEVASDDERLRYALGFGLSCIADAEAQLRPVSQQPSKVRQVLRGRDEKNVANPC